MITRSFNILPIDRTDAELAFGARDKALLEDRDSAIRRCRALADTLPTPRAACGYSGITQRAYRKRKATAELKGFSSWENYQAAKAACDEEAKRKARRQYTRPDGTVVSRNTHFRDLARQRAKNGTGTDSVHPVRSRSKRASVWPESGTFQRCTGWQGCRALR